MSAQPHIITYPSREAWLDGRGDGFGIGATDAVALLGAHPWRSPWDVWADHHMPEVMDEPSDPMRFGSLAEPAVLALYAEVAKTDPRHVDLIVHAHPDHKWARCSLDGAVGALASPVGVVEVKTSCDLSGWPEEGPVTLSDVQGGLLMPYALQAAWQIVVTGAEWADIAVLTLRHEQRAAILEDLDDGRITEAMLPHVLRHAGRLRIWRLQISRDEAIRYLAKIERLRQAHLVDGAEPERPVSGSRIDAIRHTPDGSTVAMDADEAQQAVLVAYADAKRAADAARAAESAAKARVEDMLMDAKAKSLRASVGVSAGWTVRKGSERVSALSTIAKVRPDLADELRASGLVSTTNESRHVRLTDKREKQ